jgi:ABC-2 type transport system permease protein
VKGVLVRSFRELQRAAIGWSIAVAGVALMYAAFYPSVRDSAASLQTYLNNLPDAVKSVIGGNYTTPAGYLRSELFSSLGVILFLVFTIGAGARAIAGEEERRTLDLVLSTPIRRRTLLTDKALAIVAVTLILGVVVFLAVLVAGPLFDLTVPATRLAGACLMLVLLAVGFGSIALAIGTATGRRTVGSAVAGGIAVVSLILNALAVPVSGLDVIRPLSPFRWYLEPDPLLRPISPVNVLVLSGIAVVAYVVALLTFERRDLSA